MLRSLSIGLRQNFDSLRDEQAAIDRDAYLHDPLVKLSGSWLTSRIDGLLPENYTPSPMI